MLFSAFHINKGISGDLGLEQLPRHRRDVVPHTVMRSHLTSAQHNLVNK